MRMSDLQTKKVISISSGKNIGSIIDANIKDDGMIDSFIIDQNRGLFSLNKDGEARIFWNSITKIGEDVILVQKDS